MHVRWPLQVDAARVTIGTSWEPVLRRAVRQVAEQLGLPEASAASIDARLYKLLLYEQGGHFAAHQDTEKEPGMFGTLVVQLPCAGGHEGGRLLVRHGGGSFQHDFAQVGACGYGLPLAVRARTSTERRWTSWCRACVCADAPRRPCCRGATPACNTPPASPTASTS
jgi:hypothetical protein